MPVWPPQVIDEETDAAAAGLLQQLLAWQERVRGGRDARSAQRPPPRKRLVSGLRCCPRFFGGARYKRGRGMQSCKEGRPRPLVA